jgi:ribosomal protein L15, bacterial/organelle
MNLHELKPAEGSTHRSKRVGRGHGSGWGKTAGKGHKGQNARSGGGVRPGFEGGQMPLVRRIPKRGFINIFRTEYTVVSLDVLNSFEAGSTVDLIALYNAGKISDNKKPIKILANGKIDKAINVKAHKFSATAKAAIEAAGGTAVEEN